VSVAGSGRTGVSTPRAAATNWRDGIGWATVQPSGDAFYFAHSYAAETSAATARSEGIVAVAEQGPFLGVQFHPEKSGPAGARFLERCLSRV
jgi:imidazoleglycerol phosphate synthase glutamine amidotransferase subunit HisH